MLKKQDGYSSRNRESGRRTYTLLDITLCLFRRMACPYIVCVEAGTPSPEPMRWCYAKFLKQYADVASSAAHLPQSKLVGAVPL